MSLVYNNLQEKGMSLGWGNDVALCAWVHDELQIAVKEGLEESVGNIVLEAAKEAGEFFKFRAPITAEYKVGRTWAETH
jgi:DNA polymerase I-like protein with 3'-5' exonuclease and polymerase domains